MTKEETDLVWLAGFIDGDGCVYLSKNKALLGQVTIFQKLVGVLNNILQMVDTYGLPQPRVAKNYIRFGEKLKESTALYFNGQKGAQLLEKLAPYFRHPRHIIKVPLYLEFHEARGEERREVLKRWLEAKECGFRGASIPDRPACEDIPYLAGYFDAEGCIVIEQPPGCGSCAEISLGSELTMRNHIEEIVKRQGLPIPRLNNLSSQLTFNRLKGKNLLEKLLPFMHHPEKIARAEFYIKYSNTDGRIQKGIKHKLFEEEWLDLRATGRPNG